MHSGWINPFIPESNMQYADHQEKSNTPPHLLTTVFPRLNPFDSNSLDGIILYSHVPFIWAQVRTLKLLGSKRLLQSHFRKIQSVLLYSS